MNSLTKNRILQQGDEYYLPGNDAWKPVPKDDFGLQVQFTDYAEVRRPSEKPPTLRETPETSKDDSTEVVKLPASPTPISPNNEARKAVRPVAKAEKEKSPVPTPSGAGETPDETARLAHAVSHLPTIVSKKAHTQEQDREIIDSIPYDLPMTDEEKAALDREAEREKAAEIAPPKGFPKTPIFVAPKVKPIPPSVIPYPDGSDCIWTGRNGTFKGYGVEVSRLDDKVMLFPFGKRGCGNCTIQFPVSVIPQIIDRLNHYITKTPK